MIIGTIITVGMFKRSQFDGVADGDRLVGDWGFTGVKFITSYLFVWPLITRVVKRDRPEIISWVLHITPFYIWYFLFQFLAFDPSGHICATLITLVLLRQNCSSYLDWIIYGVV